jgi:hypothetical protein
MSVDELTTRVPQDLYEHTLAAIGGRIQPKVHNSCVSNHQHRETRVSSKKT